MEGSRQSDDVARWLAEARQHLAQGDHAAARRGFEQVLGADPGQPEAMAAVALGLLREGRSAEGITMLRTLVAQRPDDAAGHHHLAQALWQSGDHGAARAGWVAALACEPGLFLSRLSLAYAIEQDQGAEAALPQYFRAITDAQDAGRWRSLDSTPRPLQGLVQHAMRTVNTGRRRLYENLLAPLTARFGRDALRRVERCLAVYLCEVAPSYADPRQQPTFLHFPDLPATPYLDVASIPSIAGLADRWRAIRDELDRVLPQVRGRERVFGSDALESANLAGTAAVKPAWDGYYFHRHGDARAENHAACPVTSAALDALPLCRVREHGPETLFSVLAPGTHLLPHRGVTNTRVVGHLPLIVPPDCALRVSGIEHAWVEGQPVLFDDTYLHEAWNRSDRTRVVLIFDLWSPFLDEAERLAIAELVGAIGDFRAAADLPRVAA